jgi:hypothetical protein
MMKKLMTCKTFLAGAAAAAAVFFLPAPSPATTLLKLSIEKMSVEADAVITGEVTGVQSAWRSDQTTIDTTTTVKVAECIAGPCTDEMKLMHRGGTVGDNALYIPGMPQFKQGQNVLLFLRKDPEGRQGVWAVFGMCQGMFVIEKDAKDGKLYAQQQGGAALAEPDKSGTIKTLPAQEPLRIPLKNLVKKIKKARELTSYSKEKK